MSNAMLVVNMLISGTQYLLRLQHVLAQAQAENRDVSEAELAALMADNDARITRILSE